jgi:glyoxylase-like metal-dependent hydrolase (beta-lactamase superfamily II)
MKIHHLNCGSFCPLSHPILNRAIPQLDRFNLVCHCLLIESDAGLILVDTGLGLQDVRNYHRMGINFTFNQMAKPKLDLEETAYLQITKMGLNPKDVKHIIVSHFDSDHIGGLADFPDAKIHILEDEWQAAQNPFSPKEKARYKKIRWEQNRMIKTYKTDGDLWKGFHRVQNLEGLDRSIYLVSLPGHTKGHAGVYIENQEQLFFAGDAYMIKKQLENGKTPFPISLYNKVAHEDESKADETLKKLTLLYESDTDINVFSSHDREQYMAFLKASK